MQELTLAQVMAQEPDEFKVFQACVDQCLSVDETNWTMDQWNTIRARIKKAAKQLTKG